MVTFKGVATSSTKKSFSLITRTLTNYLFWGIVLNVALFLPFAILLTNSDRYYEAIITDIEFLIDFLLGIFNERFVYHVGVMFYMGAVWGLPVLIWGYVAKHNSLLALIICAILSSIICVAFLIRVGLAKELALQFRSYLYIPLMFVFFIKGIVLGVYRIWHERKKKEGK